MSDILNTKNIPTLADVAPQEAFNTSFYNDSFVGLADIAERNKDNPAQLELESNAYIDGAIQDMPSAVSEKAVEPLVNVKNSYVKQATETFNDEQVAQANAQAVHNVFVSKNVAEIAGENAPEEVQATLFANFLSDVDGAVSSGKLTRSEGIKLTEDYTRNLIIKQYGSISRDPNLTIEQKLEWRRKFIDGETGEPAFDKNTTPEDRLNSVLKIENANTELEAREARMKKQLDGDFEDSLEEQMTNLLKQQIDGKMGSKEFDAKKKRLIMMAKTPEQIKKIQDLDKVWEVSPSVKLQMSEAEQNGTANKAFYYGLWEAGFIPMQTYIDKTESLNDSLHTALNSSKGEQIKSRMKSVFNYDNLGKNEAYNVAWSAYQDYLAALDHVATSEDHEKAYEQAIKISKAFPGDTLDYEERAKDIRFMEETGLPYYRVNDMYSSALADVSRKLKTKNIDEEANKDLIYSTLFDKINKELNNKNKTNIAIDKFKQRKGE